MGICTSPDDTWWAERGCIRLRLQYGAPYHNNLSFSFPFGVFL